MMRALKIISISLVLLALAVLAGYYFYKNRELNKSYESATKQVTQLQAKLDAVGTFADVWTVKTEVKMGQEIKEDDLIPQTIPTSSVPANSVKNKKDIVGSYYRIGFGPGVTLTNDLVNIEKYIGSVYDRDLFLDSVPVGTQVGDYLDIRVVLPGGEEFVVFPHKRVNARAENSLKMRFDEADLWLYTSMMRDRSLYKAAGLQIYATKYNDPGAHDKTVAYYPVRKEVVDTMNISGNLTDAQKSRIWNENLRKSIDAKLKFYSDPLNTDSSKIQSGVSSEESKYNAAETYYSSMVNNANKNSTNPNGGTGIIDPNNPTGGNKAGTTPNGGGTTPNNTNNSNNTNTNKVPDVVGDKPKTGTNSSVIKGQEYLGNLGDNLSSDDAPIK